MSQPSAIRPLHHLARYRLPGQPGDARNGVFRLPSPLVGELVVICSADAGWDHVSVSLHNRTPTWAEMDWIKRQFFQRDAVVMQLHVAEAAHISHHPYCLHLWRSWDQPIPLPPHWMVA